MSAPRTWASPQADRLEPYREQIATWLQDDHLQLTRIQELLGHRGCTSRTRRCGASCGRRVWKAAAVDGAHGADAARRGGRDGFRTAGPAAEPGDGQTPGVVWGLSIVLVYSRHSFLWPLVQQTVEATIEGLERAWAILPGPAQAVDHGQLSGRGGGPDPLNPRPTRAFLEYSQARGFLLDPARVRSPRDKPHVERGVQYARGRFWKGGTFIDLADAAGRPNTWCLDVAGQRVHGTTRQLPLVVFNDEERAHLLPYDGVPYDVPLWRDVTVHPDHHVSVQYALYSAPSTTCPPGHQAGGALRSRRWSSCISAGELVKVHPRKPKGGRSTDADDYPPERTAYAMRSPDRLVRQAMALGPHDRPVRRAAAGCTLPLVQAAPGPEVCCG